MQLPTLSVIVPNYNHSKYLPQSVRAIMSQSVPATEVIIVDDCSTDNSMEVIQELANQYPTLKFVRNERNQGVSLTVNRGFELARGDYVLSSGADDLVEQGLFEKSLQILARHPQAALSATICRFEDTGTGAVYYLGADTASQACYISPDEMAARLRSNKLLLFTSTMIFRRAAMKEAGFFHPDLRWHSDWFAFIAAGFRHGICFVPEVLGVFRVMPGGYSKKGMRQRQSQMEVLGAILSRLDEMEYSDLVPRLRDSTALATFGKEMLWLILTNKRYWKYLTCGYLLQATWWTLRIESKKVLPAAFVKAYLKMAGYGKAPK
jgi:glycosyltransferase involved in cell wall biosynthesis